MQKLKEFREKPLLTTLADIAKAAGVTPAVVSRVINNDKTLRIGKETRSRVLKLIEELEYAPNIAARSLRSAKSGMIAMVVHDVSNPVYSEIMRGAQEAAARFDKSLLLSDASGNPKSISQLAHMIGGGGVDGVILQAAGGHADEVVVRAAKRNVPTVLLQAQLDTKAHLITLPDEQATYLATRHLLELGHRHICCLGTAAGLTFTKHREAGWKRAMSEAGLPAPANRVVHRSPVIENGASGTAELLDLNPDLTAIVYFNTLTAFGALEEFRRRQLRIPEDVSIVSVHELKLAEFMQTPLTTVAMPLFEMGQRAIELVSTEEANSDGHTTIDGKPPKLIVRQSTAALR